MKEKFRNMKKKKLIGLIGLVVLLGVSGALTYAWFVSGVGPANLNTQAARIHLTETGTTADANIGTLHDLLSRALPGELVNGGDITITNDSTREALARITVSNMTGYLAINKDTVTSFDNDQALIDAVLGGTVPSSEDTYTLLNDFMSGVGYTPAGDVVDALALVEGNLGTAQDFGLTAPGYFDGVNNGDPNTAIDKDEEYLKIDQTFRDAMDALTNLNTDLADFQTQCTDFMDPYMMDILYLQYPALNVGGVPPLASNWLMNPDGSVNYTAMYDFAGLEQFVLNVLSNKDTTVADVPGSIQHFGKVLDDITAQLGTAVADQLGQYGPVVEGQSHDTYVWLPVASALASPSMPQYNLTSADTGFVDNTFTIPLNYYVPAGLGGFNQDITDNLAGTDYFTNMIDKGINSSDTSGLDANYQYGTSFNWWQNFQDEIWAAYGGLNIDIGGDLYPLGLTDVRSMINEQESVFTYGFRVLAIQGTVNAVKDIYADDNGGTAADGTVWAGGVSTDGGVTWTTGPDALVDAFGYINPDQTLVAGTADGGSYLTNY
ncbi:MAG: hypothetical protein FWF44_01165 [Defluviitaleaceae bacterium]|nr:hypothetical protein [Defluviitaleaceae bacterium]